MVIQDNFGTEIKVGNVIVLSKGTRGHRNLDCGIVTKIGSGSKVWITTVTGYKPYNYQTRSAASAYSLYESKHLTYLDKSPIQKHIAVITGADQRESVEPGLRAAAAILIKDGTFPADYVLGQAVEVKAKVKPTLSEIPEIKISDSPDLLAGLGMPSGLIKGTK